MIIVVDFAHVEIHYRWANMAVRQGLKSYVIKTIFVVQARIFTE